jgi:hypothetical protein
MSSAALIVVVILPMLRACLAGLQAAPDSIKQPHSIFFLPNTTAPKTPDPSNPWI